MLNPTYVIPGYTFFYWGFNIPKRESTNYIKFFRLGKRKLQKDIKILIGNKEHNAKIRLARITTPKFPNREVIQIFYDREPDTLKALRKLFVYSYASTINKSKSALKELFELYHIKENQFKIKVISKQKTDFDSMFKFLEDKNLFDYWKDSRKGIEKNFFIDFSRKWIPVERLNEFKNRVNVIYLLYHSKSKQLYVGKANRLGDRVTKGKGRIGLANDWDKFMFFEIDPEFNPFIEQIEAFTIRTFASLINNDVGMEHIKEKNVKLVNKQLVKK